MPGRKRVPKRRSTCPLNASVEVLGDQWSLLIVRDMMLRGSCSFKQLQACDEGIASNILADRLRKLTGSGIIVAETVSTDARKRVYVLTDKGIDLAPVLTEMVLWAAAHEETGNRALVRHINRGKDRFLAEIRDRWAMDRAGERPSSLVQRVRGPMQRGATHGAPPRGLV